MARYGMIFRIKPELKEEYKKAHDEIWPEMAEAIKKYGYRNYSIFFRKDGLLFAYLEHDNLEKEVVKFAKTDVYKRWQHYMDKYFIKEDKSIIGPVIEMLEEVFHID